MKTFKMLMLIAGGTLAACSCSERPRTETPDFKYLIDEFADLKVMRYRIPGWEDLSLRRQTLIYHLGEAAKYGRDILWDQNFKYGLNVRKTLETILEQYEGDRSVPEFEAFTVYAKRVFFSNGIHHHYAEDKIIPGCPREYFAGLMQACGVQDPDGRLLDIIYRPDLYPQRKYTGKDKDLLQASAVNFYEGVTRNEAENFYRTMEDPDDPSPLSYGLNSRLVRRDGEIREETYRTGGLYGPALERICAHLDTASRFAENETQRRYILQLIDYYRTGDLQTWDDFNVAWVQDNESEVDFVNGFIETYNDPLGMKATWEAVVNFKDKAASERTRLISENAQWFEDHSPIDDRFKKPSVRGVSAKVINATALGGDCFPTPPIGINLPNADWIRKDHGSKSVTIANITEAYNRAAEESPRSVLKEFAWDEAEIERAKRYGDLTGNLHTDLHECLGHGSGQLLPGTSPNALAEYASALEESRADLFALYYLADPKLVELGIVPDGEAYRAEYDNYIRNGILTQFSRVELGKTNTQAHMQCRKLIAEWCYEKGRPEGVIEKRIRDGKTYFVITDYARLRTLFGSLLAEIQRIKSTGDYAAGRELIERYAVQIDPELHREVRERYDALQLKPYGGFVNPEIIPVRENGNIVSFRVEYPDDFLGQMLRYGHEYATLAPAGLR